MVVFGVAGVLKVGGVLMGEPLEVYKAGVGLFLSFPLIQSGRWGFVAVLA